MKIIEADFGNWHIQCLPEDGGRISILKYAGQDLLTLNHPAFKPPDKFYGEYETRPVYGYDDCFPSVDPCIYPDEQFECRDHGELCWQKWQVNTNNNSLICYTKCDKPRVAFKRTLEFSKNKLTWRFEVTNESNKKINFLHVMHSLLPLERIESIQLPAFGKIAEENKKVDPYLKNAHEVANHLLSIKDGTYVMLLLKEISEGSIKLGLHKGITLHMSFDINLFPTIGIWWNKAGYPDEEGMQRTECAFEPIPGTCSNLSESFRNGVYLSVGRGKVFSWEIKWEIENS